MNYNNIAYLGMSLDGYIADGSESVKFLEEVEGEGDNGYSRFYETIDVVIMGANTYHWLIKNGVKENPYPEKKVIVLSSNHIESDWDIEISHQPISKVEVLQNSEIKTWVVGGAKLIDALIDEKVLDYLYLTIAPTIIGKGIKLFDGIVDQTKLQLLAIKRYNQFVEIDYKIRY